MSKELAASSPANSGGSLAVLEEQFASGAIDTQIGTDDQLDALCKSPFLQILTLYSKQEQVVEGKIKGGHFGIKRSEDIVTDLGEKVDVLVLARRPKAMDFNHEKPITTYDPASKTWADIEASFKLSGEAAKGYAVGTSFLVFERSTGEFLELYFGSKSTAPLARTLAPYTPTTKQRQEAGEKAHGPLVATLTGTLTSNSKGKWHIPAISPCSTPMNRLPSAEVIVAEINKFVNPKSDEVVEAPANKRAR